jgi:predicted AAA+ superfamily ATPase
MRAWEDLHEQLNQLAGRNLARKELLQYCLAFMNSRYAQERLVTGHRPTPKGSYAITEAYLAEIPIPVPSHKKDVIKIIELVKGLERSVFELASSDEMSAMEDRLQTLVDETLATVKV